MNKILVHASKGYVAIARYNEQNEIVVEKMPAFLEEGKQESTIANCMVGVIKTLKSIDISKGDVFEIATISGVADKINSNILIKEYYCGSTLNSKNPQKLTEEEIKAYKSLIINIKKTYGNVLYRSEEYVPKSAKPSHTEDQKQWLNLYLMAKAEVDKYVKPSQVNTTGNFDEEDDIAI